MTEKACEMSSNLNSLGNVIIVVAPCLFVIGLLAQWHENWMNRRELWLCANIDEFPAEYRKLLNDIGVYITDDTVQKHLEDIFDSFAATLTLLRLRQIARAEKRFAYAQRCVDKALRSAEVAACNAESRRLLEGIGDEQFDEVRSSTALIEKRRRAMK